MRCSGAYHVVLNLEAGDVKMSRVSVVYLPHFVNMYLIMKMRKASEV